MIRNSLEEQARIVGNRDTVIAVVFLLRPADAARARNSPVVERRVPSVWKSGSRGVVGRSAARRSRVYLISCRAGNITAESVLPRRGAWKRRRYRSLRIIRSQGRCSRAGTMPLPLDAAGTAPLSAVSERRTRIPRSPLIWMEDARCTCARYDVAHLREADCEEDKRWAQQGRFEFLIHI